jgi:hypothetical protein
MSEALETSAESAPLPDELTVLKMRAAAMGITHSNNISVETLRAKIEAKKNGTEEVAPVVAEVNPLAGETEVPTKVLTIAEYLKREQMKLVRIRVTNMDPKDKDLQGQIFTVANEYLGTVRKYVPFGEKSEDGWHVPYCIYELLKAQEFINITSSGRNGQEQVSHKAVKKFAIEVLDPLTPQELNRLASTQAAAGLFGTDGS